MTQIVIEEVLCYYATAMRDILLDWRYETGVFK